MRFEQVEWTDLAASVEPEIQARIQSKVSAAHTAGPIVE